MRKLRYLLAAGAMVGGVTASVSGVATAQTPPETPGTVVASGLNNPRQMAFGPDGGLYVAEAGTGQLGASDPGGCFDGPEGPSCAGNTSSITKITDPGGSASSARVVTGLLSFAGPDGTGAVGLDALSVTRRGGKIYGIETYGPANILPASVANQNGQLIRIDRRGKAVPQFDVGAYSLAHPLPGHEADTDPYGIHRVGNENYVADAANNTVYRITDSGKIETVATFEFRPNDPIDGVPTSVTRRGNKFYVGQLSSLEPGAAKVTVFDDDWNRLKVYDGLSSVNGVAVARNGDIYATEIFTGAPFSSPGALVKIPHDGGPRVTTPLPAPGGVAVDDDGNVFVSINSVQPGTGSVIRLDA